MSDSPADFPPLPQGVRVEDLLAALLAKADEVVLLVGEDGLVRWASPSWERRTRHPASQLVGRPFDAYVHPEDKEEVSIAGERPVAHVLGDRFRVKDRDGRELIFNSRGAFVPGPGGRFHLLVWEDVSAMDGLAAALISQSHREPLPAVISHVLDGIPSVFGGAAGWLQLVDADGRLRSVAGPALPRGFVEVADGFPVDDPAGPTSGPCIDGAPTYVSDFASSECAHPFRREALRVGVRALWSNAVRDQEGKLLGVLSFLWRSPQKGEPPGAPLLPYAADLMAGFIETSHAREAAEQAHRELAFHMENSPLAAVELDRRFRVTRWSAQAQRMLGWRSEEVIGRTGAELGLVHPDDQERAARIIEGLDRGTFHRGVVRGKMKARDGRPVDAEWHISALRDEEGRLLSFLGLGQDLSERNLREETLRRTQKLESLGVLAGGIAHDFNNLLTAILGHTELARRAAAGGQASLEHLWHVEEAAERAADLTRQLLAYAGRGPFSREVMDLNAVLAGLADLLGVFVSKKAALLFDLSDVELPVESDPERLEQVVTNLVANASDALGDDGGTIALSTRLSVLDAEGVAARFPGRDVTPGPFVVLEVRDTGQGMDEETRARIFDPFFTTREPGRGLGLSAVDGIVRSHHGAVEVESEPGRGTTVRVWLPAAPEALVEARRHEPGTRPAAGRRTVLVVDDEVSVRVLAGEVLKDAGFEVLYASHGGEAVEVYREHRDAIALVLLDMTMPVMDGAETFEALLQLDPGVTVLLSSGHAEAEAFERFARRRPAGFLHKPYTINRLVAKVQELIGG